jgi:DNA-directed RNA polymerase subunit RPC12/RpoP
VSDLIDRQQAVDEAEKWFFNLKDKRTVGEVLKDLPSIQPEHKVGRWMHCPQNVSWLYVYKCSECGGYLQISDVDGKGYKANYCSYCGARMENGGEQK